MLAKEVMKDAVAVENDIKLDEASKIMDSKKIKSIVLIKNDNVLGIVTKADIVKNVGKNLRISSIMNKVYVSPDDSIEIVMKVMKKNKMKIVPVTSKNKLLGVISIGDFPDTKRDDGDFIIQ